MTYEQKLERISEFAENETKRTSRDFRNACTFDKLRMLRDYSAEVKESIDKAVEGYRAAVVGGVDSPWLEYGETAFENLLVLKEMFCQMNFGIHEAYLLRPYNGEDRSETAKRAIDELFNYVEWKTERHSKSHSPEGGQSQQ